MMHSTKPMHMIQNRCMSLGLSQSQGITLHMTRYAPAYTKSIKKGSFFDIQCRRRLLQKGYIFRC